MTDPAQPMTAMPHDGLFSGYGFLVSAGRDYYSKTNYHDFYQWGIKKVCLLARVAESSLSSGTTEILPSFCLTSSPAQKRGGFLVFRDGS